MLKYNYKSVFKILRINDEKHEEYFLFLLSWKGTIKIDLFFQQVPLEINYIMAQYLILSETVALIECTVIDIKSIINSWNLLGNTI